MMLVLVSQNDPAPLEQTGESATTRDGPDHKGGSDHKGALAVLARGTPARPVKVIKCAHGATRLSD